MPRRRGGYCFCSGTGHELTEGDRHNCRCNDAECAFSTKNAHKARDPEMHQTKKGSQWCFGIKGISGAITAASLSMR
jgi:hypothetical protein